MHYTYTEMSKKFSPILILFIIIVFCFSCKKEIEITPLNPIKLPEISESLRVEEGCYGNVFLLENYIIMTANKRCDPLKYHVYNKNNLDLITKFGTDGLAPFEFPGGWWIENASITQKVTTCYFTIQKLGILKQ